MAPEESVPKSSGPPWLEIVERVGKIASLVAIPIVIPLALASYSAKVQENAQKETINRDYVQLAVSILKEKKDESNTQLRDSAVDLLTEHSPTKFAPNVVAALKAGTVSLPQFSGTAHESTRAVAPNGQLVATSDGRSYSVWDVTKGRLLTIADTVTTVTALEFSPDSALLAVGFPTGLWCSAPLLLPISRRRGLRFKRQFPQSRCLPWTRYSSSRSRRLEFTSLTKRVPWSGLSPLVLRRLRI